jgi:S1-C subfamily serine protease
MMRLIGYVIVFILGFGVCTGIYYAAPPKGGASHTAVAANAAPSASVAPTSVNSSNVSSSSAAPGSTIYSVAKVEPSVVNIDITGRQTVQSTQEGPFGFPFGGPMDESVPIHGQASGVIISSDGYILTNDHVAGGASTIRVTLHDGRKYGARVIGLDPRSDLAVIKINATGLPAASIGNSSNVKLGQWVIAVGNPLGIGTTATEGIISAVRSPFDIKGHVYPEIIQTDAAINPGNSGGALADLDGNIIGINSAIASTNGASIGIGFAIPINMAMEHANDLIKHGSVIYPWLGVEYQDQSPDQPVPVEGVRVVGVNPSGPAASAGVQSGDIITEVDGHRIDEPEKLNYYVMQHRPGQTVNLMVWRNGHTSTLKVTLGNLPAQLEQPQSEPQ